MADETMDMEGGKSGGGGGLKKILIIVIVLVVVLVGAAVALRFIAPGLIPGLGEKPSETPAAGTAAPAAPGAPPPPPAPTGDAPAMGELYSMNPFIVNLVDPTGKRYLKLTLALEMDRPELKTELESRKPQVRDAILILLSSMSYDDIATMQGKTRLRTQIITRVNQFLRTGRVTNVYFSEFVVQ
jgi:flagellar FliL protein